MNNFIKFLTALAFILCTFAFAVPTAFATPRSDCIARCKGLAKADWPGCFSGCPAETPIEETKFCEKEGKSIPLAEWTQKRCLKPIPPNPADAGTPPPPPPEDAGPTCGPDEIFQTENKCVCAVGYGRLYGSPASDGPCLAVCIDGYMRDSTGKCSPPPPCETCKPCAPCQPTSCAPCQPVPQKGGDNWWLILLLCLSLAANFWLLLRKKDKQ